MGKGNLRNEKCPCQSNKKYKNCCYKRGWKPVPEDLKLITKEVDGVEIVFKQFGMYDVRSFEENEDKHEEKSWFRPLCSEYQIERIFYTKNASDYLLKLRAESILDNMRLYRVMMSKMEKANGFWNFINEFDDKNFIDYLNLLEDSIRAECNKVEKGFVYSDEPNGQCIASPYGNIITVSESLKHFLYYMNIGLLDFGVNIPYETRLDSLRIALRVMLQNESMDFELDSRGEIPQMIHNKNVFWVDEQLEFIIGHEYSHHYYKHLDKGQCVDRKLYNNKLMHGHEYYKYYNMNQKQEFQADIGSLELPQYSNSIIERKIISAIFFFSYIDIYEHAKECICPSVYSVKTHPEPVDRIWNIFNHFKNQLSSLNEEYIKNRISENEKIKKILSDDISFNMDVYEMYGSVYLTNWKKKMLIDRVDY